MDTDSEARKMSWGEEPEFFGPRHYFRESLMIRHLKKRVGPGARVLDAGSGNGSLSIRAAQVGCDVVGIDASEGFILYAKEKSRETPFNGTVSFQRMDILNAPFEDASFDAVLSGEVLEHLEQDGQAVQEFYRLLRKGGYCIVSVPAHPRMWDPNDEWAGHFRRYTMESLKQLFARKGFAVEHCHYWGFPLIRLFHQFIYLPMVRRKIMQQGKNITQQKSIFFRIVKNQHLHRMGAFLFRFDNLFNAFPLGIGLLIVAKKSS